jgi:hypothetical protein
MKVKKNQPENHWSFAGSSTKTAVLKGFRVRGESGESRSSAE